jgi:hypothetical protein
MSETFHRQVARTALPRFRRSGRISRGFIGAASAAVTVGASIAAASLMAAAWAPRVWAADTGTPPPNNPTVAGPWFVLTIIILFTIVALLVAYLFYLQKKFLETCREMKQLDTFAQAPAGLPSGTIRSVLTLIVLTFSMYLVTLHAFNIGGGLPETLAAILSTIIGFYFGSRTAGKAVEEVRQEQGKQLQEAKKGAQEDNEKNQIGVLLNKAQKGLRMTKLAAEFLPQDMRQKYSKTIDALETGIGTAEKLTQAGSTADALKTVTDTFELFTKENPVLDIVKKANGSFGRVLGDAVPSAALITAVVTVGTRLVGVAYEKWRARVLHAPFAPAVIPLKVVDANTGFTLLLKSPTFKSAFSKELEANDRKFMTEAVRDFIREDRTDALFEKYKDRFESQDAFEAGLQEFRRAAADLELGQVVESQWVDSVGNYDKLVSYVDKLSADPEAEKDLHALFSVAEKLQEKGEPVTAIFEHVREEVAK